VHPEDRGLLPVEDVRCEPWTSLRGIGVTVVEHEVEGRNGGGSLAEPDALGAFLRQISRRRLLSAEEEVALSRRIERGDRSARDLLVESNLRLVVSVAKGYRGLGVPLIDLIQEGTLGLTRAAERFDWRRGCRFSTYATFWIKQAVHRAVANEGRTIRLPVHVAERRGAILAAQRRLALELGREATRRELAEATGLPIDAVSGVLDAAEVTVSLDQPLDAVDGTSIGDLVADDTGRDAADETASSVRSAQLRRALGLLTPRQRRIVELRFGLDGEPWTLEAVAAELGVARERVRQIEEQALAAIARSDLAAGLRG
jgi:RNA polymerase primary sigma factor